MDKNVTPVELTRDNLLNIIRTGLKAHSLTIKELELRAGISTDSVRDFLRGKTYILRADKAQKVLAILAPDQDFF